MSKQKLAKPRYTVSISDDPSRAGALLFTFVPKGAEPGPPPQYIVSVQGHGNATAFRWIKSAPTDDLREELEATARERVMARQKWLERLLKLVTTVKEWAEGQDWSTRIVDKKLEDDEVGNHKAPALLLQDGPVRLFLDPIARSTVGSQGVVDLYLMPAYDDVASLFFYNRKWNLRYTFKQDRTVATVREEETQPLTRESLLRVLIDMKKNAE